MKKFTGFIMLFFFIITFSFVSGCGNEKTSKSDKAADDSTKVEESTIEITDDIDRTVVIPESPEKIVPLTPTILNLLYDVGGKASARMTKSATGAPIVKEAEDLEEVGHLYNINVEKLVAAKPDLVLGQIGLHEKLIPILEENNIPIVIFDIETYADSIDKIQKISNIVGTEEKGDQLISDIDQKVKAITDKLPEEKQRIAIVYVTSQDVTLELDNTVAGDAAKIFGFENVAVTSKTKDLVRIPFSMEELVKQDPDIIFISTRSGAEEVNQKKNTMLMQNPAWASIPAVKEGRVFELPAELFVVCPATNIDQSIEYMAKLVYPEVFGAVQ